MKSIWQDNSSLQRFEGLPKDTKTEVLIIGGGITGILTAFMLRSRGIPYILAEAETVCNGVTKNTTAKITAQHGLIYDKIIGKYGEELAKQYLDANLLALKKYRELCLDIDCDFEEKDSYVYSLSNRDIIENEIKALRKLDFIAELVTDVPLPFKTAAAIKFSNQAQFNPLKFISSISKGLNIYENTRVIEIKDNTAITTRGKITASKIIVTTHFPFINKHGRYFLKMYQHRSYVLALKNAEIPEGMFVDHSEYGLSFREYNGYLLLGGGSHRTGKQGGSYRELRNFAKKFYPDATEKYHFATQDCMTLDSIPYIGKYSKNTENMFVATGFNKWGMTSAMVSAILLCDMVEGKQNPYSEVFSPSRSILHPQLVSNVLESAINLLTPTTKRCSHLGCALKWNNAEHTWDCPCHGSRFTKDGELIDNPATKPIK